MGQISREQMEAYRSMKDEIKELSYRLEHLGEGDSLLCNSVINDYRSGRGVPQAIVGVDWKKYDRLKARYTQKIIKLEQECSVIEEYIEDISDSLLRRIFRMYYVEGRKQREIAELVHMDRSLVSKKISGYFKVAPNSHFSHV